MSKEKASHHRLKLSEIIDNYRTTKYSSPHPWDEWFKNNINIVCCSPFRNCLCPDFPIVTVLGEETPIKPKKISQWDFDSKYLTASCTSCPFYATSEPNNQITDFISLVLKIRGRDKIHIPEKISGICIFDQNNGGQIIKKFLIPHKSKSPRGCPLSEKIRAERHQQRFELQKSNQQ